MLKGHAKNFNCWFKTIFRKINIEETFLPFTVITNKDYFSRKKSSICEIYCCGICDLYLWASVCFLALFGGHIKNIHLHSCKHKTVTLKLTLTLTLTLTDTGGAVLSPDPNAIDTELDWGYKLKRKIQNWDCEKNVQVYILNRLLPLFGTAMPWNYYFDVGYFTISIRLSVLQGIGLIKKSLSVGLILNRVFPCQKRY